MQNLYVPSLGMFDVEHRVDREVQPFLGRDAEPAQCCVDKRGTSGRGHFDHAEGADRMKRVSAVPRESDHGVAERQSLGNDRLWRREQLKKAGKPLEHRAVHALARTAAHLVPEIAGHFQFCLNRHFHLGHGEQVFEASFAGDLLKKKPLHLLDAGGGGEPWEQRVTLPRAGVLELLEPGDESIRLRRDFGEQGRNRAPLRLDHLDLGARHPLVRSKLIRRCVFGQPRPKSAGIVSGELGLKFGEAWTIKVACPANPFNARSSHRRSP
jgi:hypothetical protein